MLAAARGAPLRRHATLRVVVRRVVKPALPLPLLWCGAALVPPHPPWAVLLRRVNKRLPLQRTAPHVHRSD
eukprot:6291581-Prymnesium_polylepis.1